MAEVVEREGYKVRLRVSLSSEEVETAFQEVLKQQRSRVQLPGFRPGKAPEKLLEARIGAEALREAAQEMLVDRSYPQAVRELTLSPPVANPSSTRWTLRTTPKWSCPTGRALS